MVSPRDAALLIGCAMIFLFASAVGRAQSPAIDELKGRIFDAYRATGLSWTRTLQRARRQELLFSAA